MTMSSSSSWLSRWSNIQSRIALFFTEEQLRAELFSKLTQSSSPSIVGFVNAHAMNMVVSDPEFSDSLLGCDILLRDGSGLAIHYRLRSIEPGLNLNGTDLIPRILSQMDGKDVALFGTKTPYLELAERELLARLMPKSVVVARADGFQSDNYYIDLVLNARPEVIVLGMGMPKQERIAVLLRSSLGDHPCLIICGGAILDFLGGKVSRAPLIFRKTGMEWLFRLVKEPRRLFRRYVLGNPQFLVRSLWMLATDRRSISS